MRKLVLCLSGLAMMMPTTAMACHYAQASSVAVSCEQGVRVYRATPLAAPAAPIIINNGRGHKVQKQRAALQSERLAAQAERIDALENRVENAKRPQPRRRGFSAPVGAFGSGGLVNRRRGSSNRRSSGIRVRFNRRRF